MKKNRNLKKKPFEYQVLLKNRVIWRGIHLHPTYERLQKKYEHQHLSIRWKGREGLLIAKILVTH